MEKYRDSFRFLTSRSDDALDGVFISIQTSRLNGSGALKVFPARVCSERRQLEGQRSGVRGQRPVLKGSWVVLGPVECQYRLVVR